MELLHQFVDFAYFIIHFVLKIDVYLENIIRDYGVLTYVILFLIIFCETGLVVTPILPGDSLLFAAGAICARGLLDIWALFALVSFAAILGDMVNYSIGRFFGARLFKEQSRFLKPEYISRTNRFFAKYGNKAIVLCRFAPIVRTFTPFVAGFGKMHYAKFMNYNIIGGISWAAIFLAAGFFFGNLPIIRSSLTLVLIGIAVLSVIPMLIEMYRMRTRSC